jgi:hypothetical protein
MDSQLPFRLQQFPRCLPDGIFSRRRRPAPEKTAAFVLPILHRLHAYRTQHRGSGIFARELITRIPKTRKSVRTFSSCPRLPLALGAREDHDSLRSRRTAYDSIKNERFSDSHCFGNGVVSGCTRPPLHIPYTHLGAPRVSRIQPWPEH